VVSSALHLSVRPGEAVDDRALRATLRWADQAAERGDMREAVHWLHCVVACGAELPPPYAARYAAWRELEWRDGSRRAARGARHGAPR